jgi:hypothetical protein
MGCPGLHCPGCSGRQSIGILVVLGGGLYLAAEALAWVAERIWWIAGTLAVSFALALAGCVALARWTDRREARFAERRAELGALAAAAEQLPRAERPAIEQHVHYHVHLDGRQAVTRTVLPGQAGPAITDRRTP